MELAQITAGQVVMLFLLMGTGIAAVKTGVLKPEGKQTLSNLLVYLVVPAMIVNSYRMEFSMEILHNLLASFGMSLLALLIGTGITLALTARRKDSRTPIFRFACIFSNAAYMGFPLISALFGSEGLLYASAYVTVFNILLWTMGYGFVSGSSDPKEVLHSLLHTPVLYAMVIGLCIYLLQIPVPQLIAQPLELMANMTTPLSMVITGMLLAAGDLGCIVRSKPVWKLAAVRMLLIPAVCLAVFGLLGFRSMTAQVVLLLECCPSAAITSVFAVQFGHDESFAAGSVVLTTLLSIVALAAVRTGGHSAVTFSPPAFFMACSGRRKSPFARNLPVLPSFGPFVDSFANRFSFYNEILFHPCVSILNASRRSLQLFIEMQQ